MRASIAAVSAATVIVAVSVLAVPAVASGADYLAEASAHTESLTYDTATDSSVSIPAVSVSASDDLLPFINVWVATGAVLLGGGALAVGASVRKQRKSAA